MKTLGLIGGTSWPSTAEYYRLINQLTHERLGGRNSAKLILYSVNFQEFTPPLDPHGWGYFAERFTDISLRLQQAGADCILLCANTPHIIADNIQHNIHIPLIHIAEETAKEIARRNIHRVAILGTKITMEQPFFRDRLVRSGISTLIPEESERDFLHSTILDELGVSVFKKETKDRYIGIIRQLERNGAKGIVFACTEIPLLIKPEDCSVPVFDTARIHATAAVDFALADLKA